MKRFIQPALHVVTGLLLVLLTVDLLQGLSNVNNSQAMSWLNLSGVGVGFSFMSMVLLALVFCLDAMWVLFVVGLYLKKKMHIQDDDSVYLP